MGDRSCGPLASAFLESWAGFAGRGAQDRGMEAKSSLENILALFFSNSHGCIPAGFSCLGPAQRREGSFKYLTSGMVPPFPISMCPGSLGVTSTFSGDAVGEGFPLQCWGIVRLHCHPVHITQWWAHHWSAKCLSSPVTTPAWGEEIFHSRRQTIPHTPHKAYQKKICLILRQLKWAIVFIPRALSALSIRSMWVSKGLPTKAPWLWQQ